MEAKQNQEHTHRLSRMDERRNNLDGILDGDAEAGSGRDEAQEDREEARHQGEDNNGPRGHKD